MIEPNDDQGTIVRWDDHIVPILEHPDIHIRDKALLAVAWESHARLSELQRLTFGDVEDRGDHIAILLTQRNGRERLLTLYGSMPYFKRWVQAEHSVTELLVSNADPLEEAPPETPIWTHLGANKRIHSTLLNEITNRACELADVPTKFTMHDIRRSRAILLAVQLGLRTSALQERFGFGPQKQEAFVKTFEIDGSHEDDGPGSPIKCPDCGAWVPQHQPCLWCGADHE
jgi:integrase